VVLIVWPCEMVLRFDVIVGANEVGRTGVTAAEEDGRGTLADIGGASASTVEGSDTFEIVGFVRGLRAADGVTPGASDLLFVVLVESLVGIFELPIDGIVEYVVDE
jgi:hypothetical protein